MYHSLMLRNVRVFFFGGERGILNSVISLFENVQCQHDTQNCLILSIHFEQLQILLRLDLNSHKFV